MHTNLMVLFGSYLLILLSAMYIFIYIPNKKKHRRMQEIHERMKEGDEVVTIGGLVGKIVKKEGDYVFLELEGETKVQAKFIIYAVNAILTKD